MRARRAVAAIALTTDTSLLTAAANDLGSLLFAQFVRLIAKQFPPIFLEPNC